MSNNPAANPQEARYAIQKARGKGWKTLEVSTRLEPAMARFKAMTTVNPRAYFRIIQLHHKADSDFAGMEFDWRLIELYDPTAHGHQPRIRGVGDAAQPRNQSGRNSGPRHDALRGRGRDGRRGRQAEKVRAPLRLYGAVVVIGALLGLLAALRFNWISG